MGWRQCSLRQRIMEAFLQMLDTSWDQQRSVQSTLCDTIPQGDSCLVADWTYWKVDYKGVHCRRTIFICFVFFVCGISPKTRTCKLRGCLIHFMLDGIPYSVHHRFWPRGLLPCDEAHQWTCTHAISRLSLNPSPWNSQLGKMIEGPSWSSSKLLLNFIFSLFLSLCPCLPPCTPSSISLCLCLSLSAPSSPLLLLLIILYLKFKVFTEEPTAYFPYFINSKPFPFVTSDQKFYSLFLFSFSLIWHIFLFSISGHQFSHTFHSFSLLYTCWCMCQVSCPGQLSSKKV